MKIVLCFFVLWISLNLTFEEDNICPGQSADEKFDQKICNDETEKYTDKTLACCWLKTTISSKSTYVCVKMTKTEDYIKTAIKLAEESVPGSKYDLQCSSNFIIPSFILALTLLVL